MAAPIPYTAMDYNSLVQQIIDYANRNVDDADFVGSVPYFIFQAQQRIWREGKDIGFEVHTTQARFLQNQAVIKKPANWNKTISIIYGDTLSVYSNNNILEMHTYEYCRAYWPNASRGDIKNPPLYYADTQFDNNQPNLPLVEQTINDSAYGAWFIAPTPFELFYYQITYLASVANITRDTTTNILTQKFPDVLFYASMCEAFSYTQENERIQVFESLYNRALQSMNAQTQERYTDRTSKRDKD